MRAKKRSGFNFSYLKKLTKKSILVQLIILMFFMFTVVEISASTLLQTNILLSTTGTILQDGGVSKGTRRIKSVSAWIDWKDTGSGYQWFYDNYDVFDSISPVWYYIHNDPPHGIEVRSDPDSGISCPKCSDAFFLRFAKSKGIKVYPTIGMGPAQRPKTLKAMSTYRSQHIQSIVDEVTLKEYDGIDLNFEGLECSDRSLFTAYVNALSSALHAIGKDLVVTVAYKINDQGHWSAPCSVDYMEIGKVADYVRVMIYDAESTVSLSWARQCLDYTLSKIPKSKVVLANPFFDSGSSYTRKMAELVLEYDLVGLCAWTLSYNQPESGDFDVIRSMFPYM